MQIAAAFPHYVNREEVPQDVLDKEMEVYRVQAINQKKPEHIAEKIAQGRMDKFYQEVCLMEQAYIRDPNKTVQDLLTEVISKTGENIVIRRFSRFQLGA